MRHESAGIKIIATDIDDTLLRSDGSISDYTLKTIHDCRQRGIRFAFATARSECDCTGLKKLLTPDAIISNRGTLVRVGDTTIHRAVIDVETANKIIAVMLNSPSIKYITAYTDKGYHVNITAEEDPPAWGAYNPDSYTDFLTGLENDAYKITVEISDDETVDAILSAFPTVGATRFSGERWFCFASKCASKVEGVKALAAHWGIDLKHVVAFGDDYSDVEMLRECGVGVAVGNAINEVKAVASHICDTNDNDGMAKWLVKNLRI